MRDTRHIDTNQRQFDILEVHAHYLAAEGRFFGLSRHLEWVWSHNLAAAAWIFFANCVDNLMATAGLLLRTRSIKILNIDNFLTPRAVEVTIRLIIWNLAFSKLREPDFGLLKFLFTSQRGTISLVLKLARALRTRASNVSLLKLITA